MVTVSNAGQGSRGSATSRQRERKRETDKDREKKRMGKQTQRKRQIEKERERKHLNTTHFLLGSQSSPHKPSYALQKTPSGPFGCEPLPVTGRTCVYAPDVKSASAKAWNAGSASGTPPVVQRGGRRECVSARHVEDSDIDSSTLWFTLGHAAVCPPG
ncbi:hypothetical protein WMY93_032710 [Mugilogobius chulae]|uniref:Uncharacterized protein n=1 Tax=Mugilogobius chulae TaxID=88201 RepID=A0AAW0MW21_9GOBI